jgi:hypothetical protein
MRNQLKLHVNILVTRVVQWLELRQAAKSYIVPVALRGENVDRPESYDSNSAEIVYL